MLGGSTPEEKAEYNKKYGIFPYEDFENAEAMELKKKKRKDSFEQPPTKELRKELKND